MAVLMRAKYAGRCRACRGRIGVGDLIVFGGRGNAKHRGCCPTNGNYRWAKQNGRGREETARAVEERRDRREIDEIQRAEMAAERAFEQRLYGCREYD